MPSPVHKSVSKSKSRGSPLAASTKQSPKGFMGRLRSPGKLQRAFDEKVAMLSQEYTGTVDSLQDQVSKLKQKLREDEDVIVELREDNEILTEALQALKQKVEDYESTMKEKEKRIEELESSNKEATFRDIVRSFPRR